MVVVDIVKINTHGLLQNLLILALMRSIKQGPIFNQNMMIREGNIMLFLNGLLGTKI